MTYEDICHLNLIIYPKMEGGPPISKQPPWLQNDAYSLTPLRSTTGTTIGMGTLPLATV